MGPSGDERIPRELRSVVDQLRERRPEATALELDEIKLRAKARAVRQSGTRPGSMFMRKRRTFVTLLLALGLATSGTAGVIAGGGGKAPKGNAGKVQYKPGKGCGDKNHVHKREGECKKPPK